jgi:hypothetical protein
MAAIALTDLRHLQADSVGLAESLGGRYWALAVNVLGGRQDEMFPVYRQSVATVIG